MFAESVVEGGERRTCAFFAGPGRCCCRRRERRWEHWEAVLLQPVVQQSQHVESSAKDGAAVGAIGVPVDLAPSQ